MPCRRLKRSSETMGQYCNNSGCSACGHYTIYAPCNWMSLLSKKLQQMLKTRSQLACVLKILHWVCCEGAMQEGWWLSCSDTIWLPNQLYRCVLFAHSSDPCSMATISPVSSIYGFLLYFPISHAFTAIAILMICGFTSITNKQLSLHNHSAAPP